MTRNEIDAVVRRQLNSVAPEADLAALDLDANLMEALDIDSMDFLNFVTAVHAELGVDVPESDYAQLRTLGGAGRYLARRLGAS